MSIVVINGKKFVGNNITIKNNKVMIDGKDMTPDAKKINITVEGDIEDLDVDYCNNLKITGNVNTLRSGCGDVTCYDVHNGVQDGVWEEYYENGNMWRKGTYKNGVRDGIWEEYYENGNMWRKGRFKNGVQTGSGNVECNNINGYIQTGSGDVRSETIIGSVKTGSGDIKYKSK